MTEAPATPERRLSRLRLYVVTPGDADGATVLRIARGACRGGADVLQLRRKVGTDAELLDLALRCREITAAAGVLLVVNDRLDVAMACGADGVHLGQDDLPLAAARRLWPGGLAGRSTHSIEQALAAEAEAAAYLGVGPVFATPTKPGRPATGTEFVRLAAARVRIPWVAIGGIDEDTVPAVVAAGARAVAVVRAVSEAPDPEAATRRLRDAVDTALALGTAARTDPRVDAAPAATPAAASPAAARVIAGIRADGA